MRLALDPGKTTGVGWRTESGELHGIEWPGESIVVILDGFHNQYNLTEIVVENFRSRPGPAVNLSAPETIGRILGWADQYGIDIVRQDASPVKRVVTKDRLRACGGWIRGQQHARDALMHLLYREHKLELLELPDKAS